MIQWGVFQMLVDPWPQVQSHRVILMCGTKGQHGHRISLVLWSKLHDHPISRGIQHDEKCIDDLRKVGVACGLKISIRDSEWTDVT